MKEKIWKTYSVAIMLPIILVVAGLFFFIFQNSQKAIEAELRSKARALFESIVLTRSWNAHHDGVYVEKVPGVESNPYLKDPDIRTVTGKHYTKKNPALMTREISELAEQRGAFQFHITSLRLLNPDNAPDAAERKALAAFEKGEKEVFLKERTGDAVYFRYMGPLYAEKQCLGCHGDQGYKVGDVRGGISIKFNITKTEQAQSLNRMITAALFVVISASMLAVVYLLTHRLHGELASAEQRIREMAITDELTGLRNRRNLFQRLAEEADRSLRYVHTTCLILFDLDHFKQINDDHGHPAGDAVLRAVGDTLSKYCRHSDSAARYGGEEFALLLPETRPAEAAAVAEKLRAAIQARTVTLENGVELHVTASFGVACYQQGKEGVAHLIEQADQALYRAKDKGRNRVERAEGL
jgi:diguanylate cyclase (GGDEF)-like protein